MLNVVVFRTSNTYAQGHIVEEGCWQAFCGAGVPSAIQEVWTDPRNPFLNKGPVTCQLCLYEWNNGRTGGTVAHVQPEQAESDGTQD